MYKKIALTCLIVILSTGAVAKSGYYRWLDDNGQVHFTQKPPLDRPATFVKSTSSQSRDDVNPQYPQPVPPKRAESAPSDKQPEQLEILPDKDPERCEQARTALQSLSRGQRVRVKDENGEMRVLNFDEMDSQRKKAQELIDIYC